MKFVFLEKLPWFAGPGLGVLLAVVNLLVLRPDAGCELCSVQRQRGLGLGSGLGEDCLYEKIDCKFLRR